MMNKLILGAMAMIGMAMASTAAPVEVARGRAAVVGSRETAKFRRLFLEQALAPYLE